MKPRDSLLWYIVLPIKINEAYSLILILKFLFEANETVYHKMVVKTPQQSIIMAVCLSVTQTPHHEDRQSMKLNFHIHLRQWNEVVSFMFQSLSDKRKTAAATHCTAAWVLPHIHSALGSEEKQSQHPVDI
jgi:hypothetical protein